MYYLVFTLLILVFSCGDMGVKPDEVEAVPDTMQFHLGEKITWESREAGDSTIIYKDGEIKEELEEMVKEEYGVDSLDLTYRHILADIDKWEKNRVYEDLSGNKYIIYVYFDDLDLYQYKFLRVEGNE